MSTTTHSYGSGNGAGGGPWADFGNLQEFGLAESKKVSGNPKILKEYLAAFHDRDTESAALRQDIWRRTAENRAYSEEVEAYQERIGGLREGINTYLREKEQLVAERENEISEKQVEIKRIKGGDYTLLGTDADPANRLAYLFGIVILAALTVYLINFYCSIIYNAFFFDPLKYAMDMAENDQSFSLVTIANVTAIPDSFKSFGWWGPVFLVSAAFMFIALGFLLHWLTQRGSSIWWLVVLYAFTFCFDAFLAYEIVKKVHYSSLVTGFVQGEWQFRQAFQEINFYIIVFAGFGMYVVWGLLLLYILEEHHKVLPARAGIRHRRAEIDRLKNEIREINQRLNQKIGALKKEINDLTQREIGKLNNQIQINDKLIRNMKEKLRQNVQGQGYNAQSLQGRITPFYAGWCQAIYQSANGQDTSQTIAGCQQELDNFYQTIGIN